MLDRSLNYQQPVAVGGQVSGDGGQRPALGGSPRNMQVTASVRGLTIGI